MNPSIDFPHVADVIRQMQQVVEETTDEKARRALRRGLDVIQSFSSGAQSESPHNYDGTIDYVFDDHETGQAIEVRVFYSWTDYNRADEPFPSWGATVEDLRVIGVSNIDSDGNPTTVYGHLVEAAWNRLQDEHELIRERCTEDGYHNGLGDTPFWYRPYAPPATSSSRQFAARMATSLPTRVYEDRTKQSG